MIRKHQAAGNIKDLVSALGGGRAARNIAKVAGGSVKAARPQLSPGGMGFGGLGAMTPPGMYLLRLSIDTDTGSENRTLLVGLAY